MIRSNIFFRIVCPVFILCIFVSKIAFAGTTYFQRSVVSKTARPTSIFTDAAETDTQEDDKPLEFKDFLMEHESPVFSFQVDQARPKNYLNLILPITHLPIPIRPPQ